ncbi:MAG TPA: glycosyltransferase family 2 protein [Candidatus Paceibacterota bacterium]|nr:glycosyltransferase family 2 protein [Candidatus Paceibacterota bacterium]
MKFSIITPTYKRAEKLQRAIDSVRAQKYSDWEMIIINDTPHAEGYSSVEEFVRKDHRITYIVNEQNSGVNFSRNRGLQNIAQDSDWVIFLDDDDYFTPDALSELARIISERPDENWIVTGRGYVNGTSLTIAPKNTTHYDYARDYLIFRRFQGDATHCIRSSALRSINFSHEVKQGDEWVFYFQLGLKNDIYYDKIITTFSDGYDEQSGLNNRVRKTSQQLNTLKLIFKEAKQRGYSHKPSFLVYFTMRIIRAFIKR